MKKTFKFWFEYLSKASQISFGPRSEPPIPILTIFLIFLPEYPSFLSLKKLSDIFFILSNDFKTSFSYKFLVFFVKLPLKRGWRTCLFSVVLIFIPSKRDLIFSLIFISSNKFSNNLNVFSSMIFFEKSNKRFSSSMD